MAEVHSTAIPVAAKSKRSLIDNGDGTHSVPTSNPDMFALIDSGDVELVGQYNWTCFLEGSRPRISCRTSGSKSPTFLHQLLVGNAPSSMVCDHINQDPLDNRRSNLRFVTPRDNACNSKRGNSTGYTGVMRSGSNYRAQIGVGSKLIVALGIRVIAFDAAKLYDAAREILGLDPLFSNHVPIELEDYYVAAVAMKRAGVEGVEVNWWDASAYPSGTARHRA